MKKRSSYRPKPVYLNNMALIALNMSVVGSNDAAAVILRSRNHSALSNIAKGTGTQHDVDVLVETFNSTEGLVRVRDSLGADWADEIRDGQTALRVMAIRGLKTGRYLCTGQELTAINATMEIHDAQLDDCTVKELKLAREITEKIIRNGFAHKIGVAA